MQPIASISAGTIRVAAAERAAPAVKDAGEEPKGGGHRMMRDTYTPEEKQSPAGLYRTGTDGDGNRAVYFDSPDRSEEPAEPRPSGRRAERCTCNTDQVDRELERLRQEREELRQQLRSETDETRARELERKLSQLEAELGQKDNDAYRRSHAVFC